VQSIFFPFLPPFPPLFAKDVKSVLLSPFPDRFLKIVFSLRDVRISKPPSFSDSAARNDLQSLLVFSSPFSSRKGGCFRCPFSGENLLFFSLPRETMGFLSFYFLPRGFFFCFPTGPYCLFPFSSRRGKTLTFLSSSG